MKIDSVAPVANPVGRPRAFDAGLALQAAMELFWRRGYDGTSISDLTGAMGINKPSLYAAFGNKESLFRKAVDLYEEQRNGAAAKALAEPILRRAMECLLEVTLDSQTGLTTPPGCLVVQGALPGNKDSAAVAGDLSRRRKSVQGAIQRRIEEAQREGDLAKAESPADLARFIFTVIEGLAAQARDGVGRAQLKRTIKQAMKNWPA